MRVWLDGQEITGLCTCISVEKTLAGAGAEAEIRLMCAPMDTRLPRLDPACGQTVEVRQANDTLFSGRVERVSYDAAALELTLLAFDPVSLLAKNHCRGPYRGTPQQIVRSLCAECGLKVGTLWVGHGQEIRLGAACGRSVFRTIRNLYDDKCVLDWQDGGLEIYPKGDSRAVLDSGRLVDLTARNTCEEAVTQVAVYSGGKVAALATDQAGLEQYGLRRRDEYLSLQYGTAEAQAKAGLKGVARQARLTLTGRSPVKCGQIVTLDKPLMGVYGDYLVERVVWQCKGGLTTTQLGVVSQ
ncbi:MAG: hypothetical protein IKY86_02055 [Clostridia bacterium]|nr:hypothetical protein [Clostridia bacterium]